jgi:LysR family glycine cleavage system transcriptional activator
VFEAAARYLNFSKAAEELSITQPAVSHGIRQLEAAVGYPLFVRERRALSLTTQGQRLFAAVAGGFRTIAETLDDIAGTPRRDTLVVSTSTVMATKWLMPRLPRFRERHPNVMIDLRIVDRDPDLAVENIDLHLRLGGGNWPGCEACQLWPEQIVPVCSPRYLQKNGAVATEADLLRHHLIHYIDPYRFRIGWSEWLRARGVGVPPTLPAALRVNDSLLALVAAEDGGGIALGWRPLIDQALAERRLVLASSSVVETGQHFYAVTTIPPSRRRLSVVFRDWLLREATD